MAIHRIITTGADVTREQVTPTDDKGLQCKRCGCRDFRVIYTRRFDDQIRRMRECRHCGWRKLSKETF